MNKHSFFYCNDHKAMHINTEKEKLKHLNRKPTSLNKEIQNYE